MLGLVTSGMVRLVQFDSPKAAATRVFPILSYLDHFSVIEASKRNGINATSAFLSTDVAPKIGII
jgi:hypothetical protein